MTNQMNIANTILEQIGGRRFAIMTGAKNFSAMKENSETGQLGGLMFSIGRNSKGINKVIIRYMANDTYTMEFGTIRKYEYKVKTVVEEVYCDMLTDIFTDATGLEVSL